MTKVMTTQDQTSLTPTIASPLPSPSIVPVAPSGGDAILALIERSSRDPLVDIEKMERLMAMKERADIERSRRAFLAALADMQPLLPSVARSGSIIIPSKDNKTVAQKPTKYARWEDIDDVCRPIYTAHGFSLTFDIEQTPDRITAYAVLGHRDGHERRTPFSSPIEGSGFKNNTQGWGSALSYCKRYSACAALNIVTHGEDDDAKKAEGKPDDGVLSAEQLTELQALIVKHAVDIDGFLKYIEMDSLADIPASQFERCKAIINKKAAKK